MSHLIKWRHAQENCEAKQNDSFENGWTVAQSLFIQKHQIFAVCEDFLLVFVTTDRTDASVWVSTLQTFLFLPRWWKLSVDLISTCHVTIRMSHANFISTLTFGGLLVFLQSCSKPSALTHPKTTKPRHHSLPESQSEARRRQTFKTHLKNLHTLQTLGPVKDLKMADYQSFCWLIFSQATHQ